MTRATPSFQNNPSDSWQHRLGDIAALRQALDQRLLALETDRLSWFQHWRDLAKHIQPRLGRFLMTPNQGDRGSAKNQAIIDSTATTASARFGSGLMAGMTSPSRQWFRLSINDQQIADKTSVKLWLSEVQKRMERVFSESNLYRSLGHLYEDLGIFGTSSMIIYQDYNDIIRCYPLSVGEYCLATDYRFECNTLYRKFMMTVNQLVEKFGISNVSTTAKSLYFNNNRDKELIICHAIEPNNDDIAGWFGKKTFPYREIYWEFGSSNEVILDLKGFEECPLCAPRWSVSGNDAYGRSPGMDSLGDIRQLQVQQKRKAQAIDKVVNPPMIADALLKNEPATLLPGGVTYVPSGLSGVGFRPVYEVRPDIAAISADIGQCQQRIKTAFFEDLFMMISDLDTVRTATEIEERKQEKLLMLGPAIERIQNELLTIVINRTFGVMMRGGLLPNPPSYIKNNCLTISYISPFAIAQQASSTAPLERLATFVASIATSKPEVLDKINFDETITEYADALGCSPKLLLQNDQVALLREARARSQQQQSTLQTGLSVAHGMATLAKAGIGISRP